MLPIRMIAVIGFLVSLYYLYVDKKHSADKDYKAVCDINDKVSCSKTLDSEYAKLVFGIPNSVSGMLFYVGMFVVSFIHEWLVFLGSICGLLVALYLARVSYFKLKTYCLVCHGIYFINIALFVLALLNIL